MITVAVLVVIIGLAIAGAITYLGGSAYKAVKSMNRGDYSEAIEMYSDSIKDDFIQSMLFEGLLEKQYNEKLDDYASGRLSYSETLDYIDAVLVFKVIDGADKKFSEIIISRSDAIIEAYKAGTLDYSEAKQELDALAEKEKSVLNTSIANEKVSLLSTLYSAASAYETAEQQMNSGNYVDAITQLDQIPEGSDLYDDAQQKMAEASAAYKTSVLEQANAYVQSENYPGAISVIEYALTILPDDAELQNELGELQTAHHASVVSAALSESTALQSRGDYTGAMRVLSDAMNAIGEDAQLQAAYATCERLYKDSVVTTAIAESNELQGRNEYIEAMRVLQDAVTAVGDDARLTAELNKCEDNYVDYVSIEVHACLDEDRFEDAMHIVDEAIINFPSNMQLRQLKSEVESQTPKYLLDVIHPYETQGYTEYTDGRKFNMGGQEYSKGFTLARDHYSAYAIFNLNGQYNYLSMVIGHIDGSGDADKTVTIYLDGIIVAEYTIGFKDLPIKITIDLNGASQLRIERVSGSTQTGFADIVVK